MTEKEDVAKVLTEAAHAGALVVKEACDVFWGGRSGYFSDPEGNMWEVAWNPGAYLREDGTLALSTMEQASV